MKKHGDKVRDNIKKGILGEDIAFFHLKKLGYKIIDKNFKSISGEIDIIAIDGEDLVFIEVKARMNDSNGFPCESVDTKKQERIKNTARYYLQSKKIKNVNVRFDVLEILFNEKIVIFRKSAFQ